MARNAPGKTPGRDAPSPRVEEEGLIWGLNPVLEALRESGRPVHELRVVRGKAGPRIQEAVDLARSRGLSPRFVTEQALGAPKNARHQGVAARLGEADFLPLEALLEAPAGSPPPPLLVLDCIQDPHNLGAIMRSARAAGFSRIILPRERSAALGGTVAKAAAGALEHLLLCRVGNIAETLRTLKERGYWVFGAAAEPEAPSLFSAEFPEATCLVIGGEAKGIRPLVRRRCDTLLTIPMAPGCESLNASAAAAVLLFEYVRQRTAKG